MATSKEYIRFVLEQLSHIGDVSARAMMGEYVLYYRDRVIGGVYDNRFLVKPVKSALELMPNAPRELPYEGAKEMLLVEELENREFTEKLFNNMYEELPAPKPKDKII